MINRRHQTCVQAAVGTTSVEEQRKIPKRNCEPKKMKINHNNQIQMKI